MANNYNTEYYKVGFVTTHSGNIPSMLKYTGNLIVMSDLSSRDPETKKNRLSLWLRGEEIATGFGFANMAMVKDATWWRSAYNDVFGPEGADKGAERFWPSHYSDVKDSPTYAEGLMPISVENRFKFTYSYTTQIRDALDAKIDAANTYQSGVNNTINQKINNLSAYLNTTYAYTLDYVKRSYDSSIAYTDYRIKALIGEAPETIDTLGEIAYWLRNAQQLGMNTVQEIMDVRSNMIAHDAPIADGNATYTYMSLMSTEKKMTNNVIGQEVTYSYVPAGTDANGNIIYNKEEKGTYNIYEFVETPIGYNALKSEQVCTPFENHQLSTILERLLDPYPYQYPFLYIDSIGGKSAEEWSAEPVAVGSSISNLSGVCRIDYHECSISNIALNSTNNAVNDKATTKNVNIGGTFTSTVPAKVSILTSYALTVTSCDVQEYPQLKGLDPKVLDTAHVLPNTTSTYPLASPITKEFKYAFYLSGNVENITDAGTISTSLTSQYDGQQYLVDGTVNSGSATSPLVPKGSTTHVFVCMPTAIAEKASFRASIIDENTKVEQQLWMNGASKFTTDTVTVTLTQLSGTNLGMKYSSLYLSTSRYPFANAFRFKIEW